MTVGVIKSQETRERILAAAAELFAEHGFAGASVDEIARKAGVNKAMLYYYIGDKAEIFATVLEEYMEALRLLLLRVVSETDDPEERVRRMQTAILMVFHERPALPGMVVREIVAGGADLPERVLAKLGQVIQVTVGIVEDGKAKGVFRDLHPVLIHAMIVGTSAVFVNSLRLRLRIEKASAIQTNAPFTPEEVASQMSEIILHGVAKPKRTGGKK